MKTVKHGNNKYWCISQLLYMIRMMRTGDYDLLCLREWTKTDFLSGRAYETIRKASRV